MKVSFIVSAFNRPQALVTCLYSLRIQTFGDFEVIVADNSEGDLNAAVVRSLDDSRFRFLRAGTRDCYESSNLAARDARGEYLCFPSDDGYYCPRFLELMFRNGDADLIYCDCIWDGRGYGPGEECIHLVAEPRLGKIDKGGFLLRREKFTAFNGPAGVDRAADGQLVEEVIRNGATHQKVNICGWVHN